MNWQKVLFVRNDVENGPENQIIYSYLSELRHDGSDVKRQFETTLNPACRGFLLSGDTTGVFAKVHCISTPVISSKCYGINLFVFANAIIMIGCVFILFQRELNHLKNF